MRYYFVPTVCFLELKESDHKRKQVPMLYDCSHEEYSVIFKLRLSIVNRINEIPTVHTRKVQYHLLRLQGRKGN